MNPTFWDESQLGQLKNATQKNMCKNGQDSVFKNENKVFTRFVECVFKLIPSESRVQFSASQI